VSRAVIVRGSVDCTDELPACVCFTKARAKFTGRGSKTYQVGGLSMAGSQQ
jgi:hypothetical protein